MTRFEPGTNLPPHCFLVLGLVAFSTHNHTSFSSPRSKDTFSPVVFFFPRLSGTAFWREFSLVSVSTPAEKNRLSAYICLDAFFPIAFAIHTCSSLGLTSWEEAGKGQVQSARAFSFFLRKAID